MMGARAEKPGRPQPREQEGGGSGSPPARAFLFDIDGTTLLGAEALPGARELFEELRARRIPFLWLTNNTSRSREGWVRRLAGAGLAPRPEDVYTAADATLDHLLGLDPVPRVHLVGTRELREQFAAAGIALAENDPEMVVLGYDVELTYEKLRRTALLLQRGLPFLATHPDLTCPTPEGAIPDVGSFLALFEAACGRRPDVVIGKPEPTMVQGALGRLKVAPDGVVMVGDRLATDIRMARRAGIRSWLVLTGVTSRADLHSTPEHPSEVFESLGEIVERIRRPAPA